MFFLQIFPKLAAVIMIKSLELIGFSRNYTKLAMLSFLPAATKLGQGNIFTSVCQEFCPQGGGGCLPQCMLGYTLLDQAHPPGSRTPPGQAHTPWTRHTPQGADPPGPGTPPQSRHTPPRPGTPPGSRLQHTVNERPVRILLECILVVLFHSKG